MGKDSRETLRAQSRPSRALGARSCGPSSHPSRGLKSQTQGFGDQELPLPQVRLGPRPTCFVKAPGHEGGQ